MVGASAPPPPLRAPASQPSQRIGPHLWPDWCSTQYVPTWPQGCAWCLGGLWQRARGIHLLPANSIIVIISLRAKRIAAATGATTAQSEGAIDFVISICSRNSVHFSGHCCGSDRVNGNFPFCDNIHRSWSGCFLAKVPFKSIQRH